MKAGYHKVSGFCVLQLFKKYREADSIPIFALPNSKKKLCTAN